MSPGLYGALLEGLPEGASSRFIDRYKGGHQATPSAFWMLPSLPLTLTLFLALTPSPTFSLQVASDCRHTLPGGGHWRQEHGDAGQIQAVRVWGSGEEGGGASRVWGDGDR